MKKFFFRICPLVFGVFLLAAVPGCVDEYPGIPPIPAGETQKNDLSGVISRAEAVSDAIKLQSDKTGVAHGDYWIKNTNSTAKKDLDDLIAQARTLLEKDPLTSDEVAEMKDDLENAINALEQYKTADAQDWGLLERAILRAVAEHGLLTGSTGGAGVAPGSYWVSADLYGELETAIAEANTLHNDYEDGDGTPDYRDTVLQMAENLEKIVGRVESAKQEGSDGDPVRADQEEINILTGLIAQAEARFDNTTVLTGTLNPADVGVGAWFVGKLEADELKEVIDEAGNALADDETLGYPLKYKVMQAIKSLTDAMDLFETRRKQGTGRPISEIIADMQAELEKIPDVMAGTITGRTDNKTVKLESLENNVPGLFLDFDEYWIAEDDPDISDLMNAIKAAQDFISNGSLVLQGTARLQDLQDEVGLFNRIIRNYFTPKAGLGLVFVDVPAGRYQAIPGGTSLSGTPTNRIVNTPYKIAKYELTVGQWEAVMGADWSVYDAYFLRTGEFANAPRERYPAVRISWYDAIAFCNKLSALLGKSPVYTAGGISNDNAGEAWKNLTVDDIPASRPTALGTNDGGSEDVGWSNPTANWNNNGYRLPTEMEWQWAAMGANSDTNAATTEVTGLTGQNASFNGTYITSGYKKAFAGQAGNAVGNDGQTRTNRSQYAWLSTTANASAGGIRPIATLLPNELGIYDMSGNAFEWCWDWCNGGGNLDIPVTTNQTDYRGPDRQTGNNSARRLGHGGDWWNHSGSDTSAAGAATPNRPSIWNRTGYFSHIGYDQSGIRLAINAD